MRRQRWGAQVATDLQYGDPPLQVFPGNAASGDAHGQTAVCLGSESVSEKIDARDDARDSTVDHQILLEPVYITGLQETILNKIYTNENRPSRTRRGTI